MESIVERMSRLTVEFAQSVCSTLKNIIDVDYLLRERSYRTEPFSEANGTVALVHFGGTAQGDCIIVVSHKVAVNLIECYQRKNGSPLASIDRGMIDELIGVILNNSVGLLMPFLEGEVAANGFMPPIIASGNVTFPKVTSGSVAIRGETGDITCIFMLNLVGFEAVQTLATLSNDRIKKTIQASIDSLTGLKNRRYFDELFKVLAYTSKKAGSPLSIIIVDIDHFNRINTAFGRQTGDLVLAMVAQTVMTTLRGEDVACRYGGDEIVALLPNTPLANALRVAERIRSMLNKKSRDLMDRHQQLPDITISVGIAQLEGNESRERLFARAEKALLEAKKKT